MEDKRIAKQKVLALLRERNAQKGAWLWSNRGIDYIRYPDGSTSAIMSWQMAYDILSAIVPVPALEKVSLEGLTQEERDATVLSMMKKGE